MYSMYNCTYEIQFKITVVCVVVFVCVHMIVLINYNCSCVMFGKIIKCFSLIRIGLFVEMYCVQ